ncbi:RNA polymerase rpb1 c-terminal repeat domain-containing protein [Colletotrichum higginsianum IMI 349063]|uniref:RNA polymerase rpb1 c-terminal repeat domain-containing protein n=2 Tax=Colletotrichum higginsianum (strain IMI 349063) TaxID=759273 RepID=A0A1B7YS88_COLHI|nr:RNA polymerase rpb1 c-terminal repeat domain-containing protein [Colletotrichum higginsianum IMI 349063]OBR14891.1 RNA polymerase rpb1 c-terminal repeat domain-containing protein [Colletotrichum higginsianum IMI 349063]
MAPTRDLAPAKGRGRFRLRRPSVSIPDSTPLEKLDLSNANVSEISLAPMDRSADNRSDLSISSSGSWRNKDSSNSSSSSSGKPPLMFKPPALRYRASRPELGRPWRRSNEAVYPSADDTNDSDVESKYSFDSRSTITNATSVEDFDTHPSKTDTYTSAVRTRPFTVEKQVTRTTTTATIPPPPAKPANLKGARVDIVAPKRQTVHIQVAPVAPAPPVVQTITSQELREREKVEDGLLKEISRMKEETKSLLGKQSDTDKRLEDALERLSTLSADKEKTEKKRREERSLKDKIARDFDEQSRLLDDVKSCLSEHEKKLEDVARERDQLKGIKQRLEAKSNDLEKQIALERDAKDEVANKNAVLEMDIAEQEKIKKHFETRCRDLERSVGDAHYVTKETERALIERIAALELTKESLQVRVAGLETELIRRGTEIGDITAERNLLRMDVDKYKPQVDQLNKENGALTEAKRGLQARIDDLDQQKKGLEANVEKLETEKKSAQDSYDALEAERKGLEADMEKLKTEKKDVESRFGALEVEKQEVEVRLTQLETTNTEMQTRFESLEATKGELELGKGQLETQVKTLEGVKAKYDKLKTRVEGLKDKNATLQSQVGALLQDQDDKSSQILSLAEERNSLRSENASLKDENESVTSELRRAESLMGSVAGSVTPSVVGSADESDADTVKGEDDAPPPAPAEAPPAPPSTKEEEEAAAAVPIIEEAPPAPEDVKDDAVSAKSVAPEPEAAEAEAAPAPIDNDAGTTTTEKAESASVKSVNSATPSESAVMEELRQRIAELQGRNEQLQSETVKLGSLMAERDELATRAAAMEPEARQAPQLRQENAALTSQLGLVNAQLDGLRASYDASVAEVNGLRDQIGQLRGRLSSTPSSSLQSRSRESSHARQPTKTKKDNDKKKEQLVVVRNPNERGGM